jgi:hypothetical protein
MKIGNLPSLASNLVDEVKHRSTTLPPSVRHEFERQFGGIDLSNVRVNVNHLPTHVGAEAFARGQEIHFAPGQYNPYSEKGRQLISHELAHVVQQAGGRVAEQARNQIEGLEAQANRLFGDGSV